MRQIVSALVFLLVITTGSVNAVVYSGQVTDREGNPIEGVNVLTDVSSLMTVTNESGRFSLNTGDLTPDYLTFSHISFQPKMITGQLTQKSKIRIFLEPAVYPGQKIRVTAMRAVEGLTPVAFTDFSDEDIRRDYTVGDFPILLETTPNMYSFSYAGGLTGASEYKIRGFDSRRIGVYINGVPLNDPEDKFTYFYDLPDFAAEVADIQVQRGVGNSLYGDATFGGSINIASAGLERQRKISLSSGYGRFYANGDYISEMRKQAIEYSSGLIDGRWSLSGRYSKLYSGGYRKGSWYDGWAYFLSLSRLDENMTTTVNIYGGPMQAHQAWYGVDRETLKTDRRINWTPYENEIDDFNQPHYEIHNTYQLNDRLSLKNTIYYIRGKGYYEQYKNNEPIIEYNIPPEALIDSTISSVDLVRQKWVTKNQYGWNPRLDYDHSGGTATFGGSFYYFNSDHWGQVIWAENLSDILSPRHRYYEYFGGKYSASIYILEYLALTNQISLMGNIQLRYLKYDFDQTRMGALHGHEYDINWLFFSPRTGITYSFNDRSSIFFSFAVSSREPTDVTIYDAEEIDAFPQLKIEWTELASDGSTIYHFGDPLVDPERVYDFELGGNIRGDRYKVGVNLYWMEFRNEIIPEGGLDNSGHPRIGNADRSVHAGIELESSLRLLKYLNIDGNLSYNHNRLKDYKVYMDYNWDNVVDDTLDYSGKPTAGFPEYLGNLILDYDKDPLRLTYRLRAIGKQFVDNSGNENLAIDRYLVSSVSAAVSMGKPGGYGRVVLSVKVDNLFNRKYELSGYSYWNDGWVGEYYPAAERSFYTQLKWELE